jgi:hypothetical protein
MEQRWGWDGGHANTFYDYTKYDHTAMVELLKSRSQQAHTLVSSNKASA